MARPPDPGQSALRRTVAFVGLANLAYFFVEFTVARHIGSVSLFADAVDFLEDAAVNGLIFVSLAWSLHRRAQVGMVLAALLLVPAAAAFWTAWSKFQAPVAPEAFALSVTGFGALAVNVTCSFLLVRFRNHEGSLTKAAFYSARNDVIANVAIIATGLVTAFLWVSAWPDLIVGLAIAAMNAEAAADVLKAARREHRSAKDAAA